MATVSDVMQIQNELVAKAQALISIKGACYNGVQQEAGDTLFNMRVSTILGVTANPVDGILVRLSDKLMRIVSLTRPGAVNLVTDESLEDTLVDAINYLTYVKVFRDEAKALSKASNTSPPETSVRPPVPFETDEQYEDMPRAAALSPDEYLARFSTPGRGV